MPSKEPQIWSISTGTMFRFLTVVGGLYLVYVVRDVAAALFLAIIVASAMEPGIEWLKQRKIPRVLGVVLIYLSAGLLIFFTVYMIFPILFDEARGVAQSYPAIQEELLYRVEQAEILPLTSLLSKNLEEVLRLPSEFFLKAGGGVLDFASIIFGGLFSFVLIVVFSFYLAIQERGIESFLKLITPLAYESYAIDLWGRSQKKLGQWFRSQLLLGVIVGVLIFIGLTVLGIKHALFLAILAAAFELIPVAGPILAAIPAVAIAFLSSPFSGLAVVVLYIAIQQFESNVIVPVVMRRAVGLNPLIVVLAILVGAKVGGFFGILLAVPITAVLAEFVNDWDRKKRELIPV